ncbi:hypothetical protein SK128_002786, partial [Halocaridina rubra]
QTLASFKWFIQTRNCVLVSINMALLKYQSFPLLNHVFRHFLRRTECGTSIAERERKWNSFKWPLLYEIWYNIQLNQINKKLRRGKKSPVHDEWYHSWRLVLCLVITIIIWITSITYIQRRFVLKAAVQSQHTSEGCTILEKWNEKYDIEIYKFSDISISKTKRLGSGKYADVYRLDEKYKGYCVKIYENSGKKSFLREVSALLKLRDIKGIPYVLGVCEYPPCIILSEHQMTLGRWFRRHEQSAHDLVDVALQICKLVTSVHRKGICHNDIKSNNVMIDLTKAGPKVTLIDFGLACKPGDIIFPRGRANVEYLMARWQKMTFYAQSLYLGGPASRSTDTYAVAILLKKMFASQRGHCFHGLHSQLLEQTAGDGTNCNMKLIIFELNCVKYKLKLENWDPLIRRNTN